MNPWLHFGTTVHNPISARFQDHSTLRVGSHEKKTRQCEISHDICGTSFDYKHLKIQALVSDGAEFPKNYIMTTSVDLSSKVVKISESDDEVCLILTDLAGEDVFETLIEPHFDMIGAFTLQGSNLKFLMDFFSWLTSSAI